MSLSYTTDYDAVTKRLRRYQGETFGTGSAFGRFAFSIWSGPPVMIIDRTRERIALINGQTPTHPYWNSIANDPRISADPPGFAVRA
jgi:hypothetical protein